MLHRSPGFGDYPLVNLDNPARKGESAYMTIAEIKTAIQEMSLEEKLELEAYVKASTLVESPSFRAEMHARQQEVQSGVSFPSKQLREIHEQLKGT